MVIRIVWAVSACRLNVCKCENMSTIFIVSDFAIVHRRDLRIGNDRDPKY
jgi:hypothetical protein